MLTSRWFLVLGYPYAVKATECLVGCLVQGISPFDEDSLAVWGDRGACDSSTVGCEVSTINYPSASYQGALWASTSGSDGSTSCTCDICDPYPWSVTTSYMEEETSLWSRIHCYLAASEASGYDVSPCVAAILDTQTLPCVDDVYEPPTVDQFDCDENGIKDLTDDNSYVVCNWDGDAHRAQELFSVTSASSSTTVTSVFVNTNACLVGCLVQGISPFDEDSLAVWDNRGTCDSNTIGCDVIAINYPSTLYQGALWASSWGTEGSTSCTCSICDPYPWSDTTSYMEDETSLWSRIHCYLAAAEASGYDVSPCVAAIADTETLPCVDDVYEPPTVDQFECEENGIRDLTDDDSYVECNWDGDVRMVQELFSSTPASSSTAGTSVALTTNSCLVGCLVQGISPFDDDSLAVWDNRGTCDSTTIGCDVVAINYPSTGYQGALWASSWGTEGSTINSCTCSICDPYPWSDTTSYMEDETSLWSRIHCYLAAAEASGYDVSPCVAAIADTETLPCVDDVYEPPTVDQFECEENGIRDLTDDDSYVECNWDGDVRVVQELFSSTPASSSTAGTSVALTTNSCLVGCLVQGISPFDDDSLAVWDNRGTCDSTTIGCDVVAINYPSTGYQGALWASSLGTDGSSGCTCSICDPYPWSVTTSYMEEGASLWSRIHCYLVASESSGYDVSACVAAIVDTGTLPCVDDVYEPPTVDQFDCEENGIKDLADDDSYVECSWGGEYRSTDELYGTRAPSSLPDPTPAPAPSGTRGVTPQPGISITDSPDSAPTSPLATSSPAPSGTRGVTPQPGITSTGPPDSAPTAPSGTSSSSEGGPTLPLDVEGSSCAVGSTCQGNLCCHPESNVCGRKYTYCHERDFADGPRCCSGVDGDPSASNVCSEDSICDKPEGLSPAEVAGVWIGIITGLISIAVAVWKGYEWCKKKR